MLLVFAVGIAFTPSAWAESDDNPQLLGDERSEEECPRNVILSGTPSDADRLTLFGVACFKNEKFAQAYTHYRRAYEIEPSDLLRAAMGRSLHELGIYDVAEHHYSSFLEGTEGPRAKKIQQRRDQLRRDIETSAAKVDLRSFPQNATVATRLPDGGWVDVGQTPTRVALAPGRYRFKFKRAGYRNRTLERDVPRSDEPTAVEADLYHRDALFDTTAHELKKTGFITVLSSIPFLAGGAVFFAVTKDKFDEAEDYTFRADYTPADQNRLVAQGHRNQRIAIGLTGIGGATLLTGTILFLRGTALQPREESGRSPAALRAVISPRFVGIRGLF